MKSTFNIFKNISKRFSEILLLAMLMCYSGFSGNINIPESLKIKIELLQENKTKECCIFDAISNLNSKQLIAFEAYFQTDFVQILNYHFKENKEIFIHQNEIYRSLDFLYIFHLQQYFSSTTFEQLS